MAAALLDGERSRATALAKVIHLFERSVGRVDRASGEEFFA
jgi:hypothetical protein